MDSNTVISLDGVTVELGGRAIFNDVSFSIEKGEFVAILGPNGAGKTTLFKLLLGLLKPARGSISVLGAVPHRGDSNIGYAPQHRVLETDLALRARDVVGFGLDGNRWGIGFGGKKRDALIDAVLKEVDAYQFADAAVGHLSGGEQQRLLIAQALITDPKILLLDEPLSSLDISHAQEIIALLTEIAKHRAVTIMLVSHDINPLLPAANRVLYMAHGHTAMGSPDEIITSKTLSRLYDTNVEVVRSGGHVFVVGAEL
ncbi:MAG TPA: ATP-binding cassette domain-containing protein [Candidatus Paceibacterota bacterium]|nr:ATP-binding cassette domain-containing protein [Candidatus Paceibacterota bacterium]